MISAALSTRPQEVIISEKLVKEDPYDPSYQQTTEAFISIDSR